ncbi:PqqD family protein [Cohnella caldifontis]|uniref:PqqD family protein n=1 Tax=Cohnella caldifontis TaxID=3027471 RepID=UPI0023EBDBBB|nr:PqqD family protein [Cohnella sp. YIM B05605]
MSGSYSRHGAVEMLDMEGEAILLNQETFTVTKLNETGGFVWQSLTEPLTFEDLAERLSNEFRTGREAVDADLRHFLEQLTEIGLIRREE